ncbi:protein of unknown function [Georgfuchsia toluolica]|uniref:Uncharacterized protein n=1 Tax=Georgfuchsia toluolica TaxID=424218 RepID=A0A916N0D2_9PROT|nr:protein of unknown function [Georgfuchsia toluolica]
MGHFRNTPRGMNGMGDNIRANARPIALEDIIAIGNRAQRRWAAKKILRSTQHRAKANTTTTKP